jgi:integrase
MAAIFKQKYTRRLHDGTRVTRETSKYYIEFRDGQGVVRRLPGLRDRKATEAMAAELERKAARSVAFGRPAVEADRPILAHVADYDVHLSAQGVTDRWRRETIARLRWLIGTVKARRLADLDPARIARGLSAVLAAGRSSRTRDAYLLSVRALLRWARADGRLDGDLAGVGGMRLIDDRRRARRLRRAITPPELARLLASARARPLEAIDPATPPERRRRLERLGLERALIYITLFLTGLRRGELARVELRDLELPVDGVGVVTVRGKSGRVETIPIIPWLARELQAWIELTPGAALDAPLFQVPAQLVRVLRRDLAHAGIAYRDERGRVLDVHALRHATATFLAAAGVAPRTAQQVMRHSHIDLTMQTYVDPKLLDTAGALATLPLPAPILAGMAP